MALGVGWLKPYSSQLSHQALIHLNRGSLRLYPPLVGCAKPQTGRDLTEAGQEGDVNSRGKGLVITVLIVAGIFFSMIAMLVTLHRRDELVGLNKEIQYDDFAFSITDVHKMKAFGDGRDRSVAAGNYYLVSLRVANRAKRVDFKFHPDIAVLVDQAGREYHVSGDGQRAFNKIEGNDDCSRPIPAGKDCTAQVVFDLPGDSAPSHLRISGGPIQDLLGFIFFGNKRIDVRSAIN
jgi:hypothetical protein